jgi:hypothetical protein
MAEAVSEAMRALLPAEGAGEAAYPPAFRAIADLLLNRVTLLVSGEPHRFTEIELYFNGDDHGDDFTHGDPLQQELGRWYFHRLGNEYKSGTYKGLDITLGSGGAFGGVLLRGAARLSPPLELIEGPSLLVDHILRLTGSPTIRDLVGKFDLRADAPEDAGGSPLSLRLDEGPGREQTIYASPRVGLTLKRGDVARRQRFLARPYRFLTDPSRTKKGKVNIVIGLYRDGAAKGEIARLTGSPAASVARYIELYEQGKARSPADFRGDLSSNDLCELFGACHAFG